ncbi:MAG: SEL1-like repeat protein [Deltaproteobacteria bacterium]|nr:SEL1-like repeat protein [Deltaproteobacteria bacterium]
MREQKCIKALVSLAGFFMFSMVVPLPAAEMTIQGKVVEVQGPKVKVEYAGEYAPNVGDPIEIGFKIGEDFIPVEGRWTIVEVGPKFVWASSEGPGAGTPAPDYLAVVHSKNPGTRSTLASKEEKPQKKGHPEDSAAVSREAMKHYKGDGVPKDHKKAFELFKEAADLGDPLAQRYLGWMYQRGEGVEKDPSSAVRWYSKAADQNHADAKNDLGLMYLNGKGVKQDYGMAHKLFREVADSGNPYGYWNLGRIYHHGWGVDTDLSTAFSHYSKAAETGHVEAQATVCSFYLDGKGVNKDYGKAYEWCKKAADSGSAGGCNTLGLIYLNAFGVKRDYAQAHAFFEKAGSGGHSWGYFNLGRLYDNGWGFPMNEQKALEYYKKFGDHVSAYKDGARKGHEEAKRWLKKRNMDW